MFRTPVLVALALAAPNAALLAAPNPAPNEAAVYRKDVKFALRELDDKCGHFFKTKGIDWKRVRSEFTKAAKEVESDQEQFMLLSRLIARLRDGHASVIVDDAAPGVGWPDRGPFRGPALFWCVADGKVLVKNAWGEASAAGVEAGMEVVKVDDQPARQWLDGKIDELRDLTSFSTDQHAEYFACHWGLAGPQGERMKLELRRGRKSKKTTLARTSKSYVARGPAFFPEGLERIGRQSYGKTPAGYGYIHLRNTPGELPAQMDTMLAAIGEVPGLILDCRANGGGRTDHDAVFGRFVPPGKTLSFGKSYTSAGETPYAGPMVVIVDAGVRSAGETVSGMFKEDGRAYMIGDAPTAGMSSSKTTITLPSGRFKLYVSVASNKRRFNKGRGIEGIGVPPHEIVYYDPADLAQGIDTQIRRAEELLADFPGKKVPYRPERFGWKPPN